jgi:UDP-N-acetylglucosamine diphosphorylase/glucosamine-1-phosphate N-acetyltransferase
MNIILFDDETWHDLLPLTYSRPVAEIRIGILTISEKWKRFGKHTVSYDTQPYLSAKYPKHLVSDVDNIFINGKIIPDQKFLNQVKKLKPGNGIKQHNSLLAFNAGNTGMNFNEATRYSSEYSGEVIQINTVWDIFTKNGIAIKLDFELLTKGKKNKALSKSNTIIGKKELVFIEQGAIVEASVLNTTGGPIYIAKDAEVMEGSVIRGPFALGEHSTLKMAAKIYGPTTIGPHCKVGGEVNNSVIFGYSNKAHDGFLGNSVVGEWCNLGADTNNSNLKNNYGNVKLFNYRSGKNEDTGLQFCGLIMGDHSKSGINTMFNTGTVVGVGANIFGGGFPPTHIPSFSWGGAEGFEIHQLDKMFETTHRVFERRSLQFDDQDKTILKHIFSESEKFR